MSYSELSVEERAIIQLSQAQGFSLRGIARLIDRSPSTISRELKRNRGSSGAYSARCAQQQKNIRRQVCRPKRKLVPGSERFELVAHMLRKRLSPEQIAGKLRSMTIPDADEDERRNGDLGDGGLQCSAQQHAAGDAQEHDLQPGPGDGAAC